MEIPKLLYHGSLYKQSELMPGYKRTGKLVTWDGVESNLQLYASSSKREAELLGIGSGCEKVFNSNRFIELDGNIWVYTNEPISLEDFLAMTIYVYTIPVRPKDNWQKNDNPYNNIDTEYTTRETIRGVLVENVNVRNVLAGKTITLTTAPPDVHMENLKTKYSNETEIHKL